MSESNPIRKKNKRTAASHGGVAGEIDDDTILCTCTNFSVGQLRHMLGSGLDSFDTLLEKSGAGRQCTACLLDLEFYASRLRDSGLSLAGKGGQTINSAEKIPFRHKIYQVIDNLSPPLPFPLRDFMPAFAGRGLRQRLIVANDSLSYDGKVSAPPIDADVIVRNKAGEIQHHQTYRIEPDDELDLCVSEFILSEENKELEIGSLEVRRKALRSGFRGTTRPQILLEAPAGSCAVHGQDNSNPGEVWFTFYARQRIDRFFFCIFNNAKHVLDYEITYPFSAAGQAIEQTKTYHVSVPSFGARMHEFHLENGDIDALEGELLRARLVNKQPGGRKIFLLCASHDLKLFSIDHASN